MALDLPDHVNVGDDGHVLDTNLIIDALDLLDENKVEDLAIGTVTTGTPGASIHPGPGGVHTLNMIFPPGQVGPAGPQGIPGAPSTVPGPAGPAGPAGPQGLASTVPGPQGPGGPAGPTGPIGPQGPAGGPGIQGVQGMQGIQGTTGATGATGAIGATGQQGPPGELTKGQADALYESKSVLLKDAVWWVDASNARSPAGYNLLTENQASGTDSLGVTTGFLPAGASSTAQALQGSRSYAYTTVSTSAEGLTLSGSTTTGTQPVVPGQVYTFKCSIRSTAAEAWELRIYWWTSAGNVAASTASNSGSAFTTITTGWTEGVVTAIAPANAAYASMYARRASGAVGSVHYVDCCTFHAGSGGTWAMPGIPITTDPDRLPDLTGRGRDALFGAGAAAPVVLPHTGEDYLTIGSTAAGTQLLTLAVPNLLMGTAVTWEADVDFAVGPDRNIHSTNGYALFTLRLIYTAGVAVLHYYMPGGSAVSTGVVVPKGRQRIKFRGTPTGWQVWLNDVSAGSGAHTFPTPVAAVNIQPVGQSGIMTFDKWYSAKVTLDDATSPQYVMEPSKVAADYATIANTGTAGGSWTISRAPTGFKIAVVDRPLLLFGGAQRADAAIPSTLVANGFTALVAARDFGTPAASRTFLSTYNSTGFRILHDTADTLYGSNYQGTTVNSTSLSLPDGQNVIALRAAGTGPQSLFRNGVSVGNVVNGPALPYSTHTVMALGAHAGAATNYLEGELLAAAIWDRALTDAEIAQVSQELAGLPHVQQADPHPQYVLESQVGNLLTDNQASGTDTLGDTTGFTLYNSTLASSATAYQGVKSLQVNVTNAASGFTLGGTISAGTIPVTPGSSYTLLVQSRTSGTMTGVLMRIYWWTSAGNVAASTASVSRTTTQATGAWAAGSLTGTAPANAAFASVYVAHFGGTVGVDSALFDALSFHKGAGGDWAMGTPITNLGYQVTHPNVDDVLVQEWDAGLGRWQTVHYDSGWRLVASWAADGVITANGITIGAALTAKAATAGWIRVRRHAAGIEWLILGAAISGAGSTAISGIPVGFRGTSPNKMTAWAHPAGVGACNVAATALYLAASAGDASYAGSVAYSTPDAIPASLPGTLVTAAPA